MTVLPGNPPVAEGERFNDGKAGADDIADRPHAEISIQYRDLSLTLSLSLYTCIHIYIYIYI